MIEETVLSAIIVVLIIFIVHTRLCTVPHVVVDLPEGYENDALGVKIGGAGFTPLTTPGRRACAQLDLSNPREGVAM